MAMSSHDLKFILECLVCNTEDNTPKSLACGHSICNVCIDQMLVMKRRAHPNSSKIRCPSCRAEMTVPNGGSRDLPTTYAIVQLRNTLASLHVAEDKLCKLCKGSDKKKAETFCKDCEFYLCKGCTENHQKKKLWQSHSLVSLSVIQCKEHDEKLLYFCTVCKMLLCKLCYNEGICGHEDQIKEVKDLVASTQNELKMVKKKITRDIETNKRQYQPKKSKLDDRLKEIMKSKEQLNTHSDRLVRIIRNNQAQVMQQLEERESALLVTQEQMIQQDNLEALEKCQKAVENLELEGKLLVMYTGR